MELNERIDAWMNGREDELADALAPLIAVDSTSGPAEPGKPFGPGPAEALERALQLARDWGFATGQDDGYVGLVDLNDKPDALHILAHLDVVGAGEGWDTEPYQMVRDGDLIYGRGVSDDKGPAVMALLAMRCVRELGVPLTKNVKLVLGTDEESGSGDIAHYYSHNPFAPCSVTPDAAFPVTNVEKAHYTPTFSHAWEETAVSGPHLVSLRGGIRINVAPGDASARISGLTAADVSNVLSRVQERTGVALTAEDGDGLILRAHGVQAHASLPDEGKNAITALLEAVAELPLAENPQLTTVRQLSALFPYGDNAGRALGVAQEDAVSGPLTLAFSLLEINPTGFSGQFDVRAPACATEENLVRATERAFARHGWACVGEKSEVHMVEEDSDFIRTLLDCYEHFSGKPGYCEAIGGGTYVHDIPGGVAFGAEDPDFDNRIHGANERAKLSQLLMSAKIYAAVIARLCA